MGLTASGGEKHRYQHCDDDDCDLPYCRIYKEGYRDGYGSGCGAGYSDGRADGFAEGYAAGQADAGE